MNAAHEPDELLTIGEMSRRTGVAVSTRHYSEGLELIRSRRTAGNRREYRRDTLRILAFIRASQRVGISLERIKEALDSLPDERVPTTKDWARISRKWRDELTDRIEH